MVRTLVDKKVLTKAARLVLMTVDRKVDEWVPRMVENLDRQMVGNLVVNLAVT